MLLSELKVLEDIALVSETLKRSILENNGNR